MNTLFSFTFIVTCLGGVQWGLIGLGGLLGKNLNVISIASRGNSLVEYMIYLVMGICAVVYIWLSAHE
jgi:uncharacterized membrane protein YuzA (DUF378 family)